MRAEELVHILSCSNYGKSLEKPMFVAVPGGKLTLFCRIFPSCHCVQSTVSLKFPLRVELICAKWKLHYVASLHSV